MSFLATVGLLFLWGFAALTVVCLVAAIVWFPTERPKPRLLRVSGDELPANVVRLEERRGKGAA